MPSQELIPHPLEGVALIVKPEVYWGNILYGVKVFNNYESEPEKEIKWAEVVQPKQLPKHEVS